MANEIVLTSREKESQGGRQGLVGGEGREEGMEGKLETWWKRGWMHRSVPLQKKKKEERDMRGENDGRVVKEGCKEGGWEIDRAGLPDSNL